MRTRLKLDFWLTLVTLAFPLAAQAVQENLPDLENRQTNVIDIEYPVENLLPYRERRPAWGVVAGVRYENFTPTGYRSSIDGASYSSIFGKKSLTMIGPEAGAKFNFPWGSLVGGGVYQQSSISTNTVDSDGALTINMDITKMAVNAGVLLDMIWPDPYVVPYAQLSYMNLTYEERDNRGDKSNGTREGAMGFTGGVLVQLNWLDPAATFDSLDGAGVNNTYLNLFLTKVEDKKLSNDTDWGLGLLLEF